MRLYIAQAAFDLALAPPLTFPHGIRTRSLGAELTACRAAGSGGNGTF